MKLGTTLHWLAAPALALSLLWCNAAPAAPTRPPPDEDSATATAAPGAAAAPTPSGTIYYVAPDGNDGNPGTMALPWRTIQHAAETLVAGDTVYIRAGTYAERVVPQNSGIPGSEIVYAAYPGETATLDGATVVLPEWAGLFDVSGKAHIRVSGLRVVNAGPEPHNPGIQVDGSSHVVVESNYVQNTRDSGIIVWNSDHVIVDRNEVTAVCQGGYNENITVGRTDTFEVRHNHIHHNPKEGIGAKDGSSNGKVFGNHVHDTAAVGIYVDAQAEHTYNIEVFNNLVHDVTANGFSVASEGGGLLEDVAIYNNVAYHNRWVGLQVSPCCIATHPISGVLIVNNTFFDNGWDPWGGGIALDNPQATGVIVRNNVLSQNLSFQLVVDLSVPAGSYVADHNLIDGFRGAEGEIYGDDYVEGDPRLANRAAGDAHLQSDSPAIDQGSALAAPAVDFDGQPRPWGAGYDIGADEYAAFAHLTYLSVVAWLN